ncbi:tyrosine-type recombinase/integrase [Microbacterium sp. RURRCA19A]|uniref:tyrosine-type recombinase/integrase n=1 Tax=Microbacterium sp. RURRCA19A TaxID=1907391 RepID=UPI0009552B5B|nr:tyrosine-type recombinase/integrase [Microbacterium sp. RURRCA19A]SIR56369.1 Phage integrase family protein [Microbacterium sp. RURRCA19A]
MAGRQSKRRETFGQIDKLPSGRHWARYTGPDCERYPAPSTFDNLTDARAWLAARRTEIATGKWMPPAVLAAAEAQRNQTLAAYAETWLASRTNSRGDHLKPRTLEEYRRLLRSPDPEKSGDAGGPLAELTSMLLGAISPAKVRAWRAAQLATGKKTQTSRAYGLLNAIMATAVIDKLVDANPCTVKGGEATHTGRKVIPPTDSELDEILTTIKPEYRALVTVAAFGGLRYGEATALRAKDVAVERSDAGTVSAVRINVERAVARTSDGIVPGSTKSENGVRRVGILGQDAGVIAQHVHGLIGEALLFPAADGVSFLAQSAFHRHWDAARIAAGRPDMPFHALRHYRATAYAEAGATAAENNARHGWSTATVGLRYQHATDRADELAARMRRRSTA